MKVWLDDTRPAPRGWRRTRWPEEVVELLKTGKVAELSLDHDLGSTCERRDGYVVLEWIEEQVALHGFTPPWPIAVHSANTSAALRMEACVRSIYRFWQENWMREAEKHSVHPRTAKSGNRKRSTRHER